MKHATLKAPFPAFGGKSAAARMVWPRFGDVRNYCEPFFFSGAMLLLRPDPPQIETVNDLNAFVSNFWRAIQHDPEAVAAHADWPVNETDLHSRHRWLVYSDEARAILQRVRESPDAFDAKVAGWWCWGACMWIGSGWCDQVQAADGSSVDSAAGIGRRARHHQRRHRRQAPATLQRNHAVRAGRSQARAGKAPAPRLTLGWRRERQPTRATRHWRTWPSECPTSVSEQRSRLGWSRRSKPSPTRRRLLARARRSRQRRAHRLPAPPRVAHRLVLPPVRSPALRPRLLRSLVAHLRQRQHANAARHNRRVPRSAVSAQSGRRDREPRETPVRERQASGRERAV
jgi:hypothetical protein